jgi:hypothetical protein
MPERLAIGKPDNLIAHPGFPQALFNQFGMSVIIFSYQDNHYAASFRGQHVPVLQGGYSENF